ncbi:MAG: hypothetical protein AAGH15_02460 [Myxococcota bacterium]
MLRIDDAQQPIDTRVLDAPGGFAWWYVELLDETLSGLVLIAAWGLPFLPGYASAARKGAGQTPRSRPSLNLAIYEKGKLTGYLLHEVEPRKASFEGSGQWTLGESAMRTVVQDGIRHVEIDLDAPLLAHPGGGRLRGTIRFAGPRVERAAAGDGDLGAADNHAWTPLVAPCRGTAQLDVAGRALTLSGDVYHDRNASDRALHDLGFERWVWGHAALPDRHRIFYVLWPQAGAAAEVGGYEVLADGTLHAADDLTADFEGRGNTFFGMPAWRYVAIRRPGEAKPWFEAPLTARVDDGFFYLRYLFEAKASGRRAAGSLEVIDPGRVDLGRHRRFVRMRVSSDTGAPSPWLPLFQGDLTSKWARLGKGLLPR